MTMNSIKEFTEELIDPEYQLFLDSMADGDPHYDPYPTVVEEIEILQIIEANLKTSFDGKISPYEWDAVESALDSEILEIKTIATRILSHLSEQLD